MPVKTDITTTIRQLLHCPELNEQIEEARTAHQKIKNAPVVAFLHTWPTTLWRRDLAGPFQGRMFLIVVDSHLK